MHLAALTNAAVIIMGVVLGAAVVGLGCWSASAKGGFRRASYGTLTQFAPNMSAFKSVPVWRAAARRSSVSAGCRRVRRPGRPADRPGIVA